MNNIEQYIMFNNQKLISIGFTKSTIMELVEKFSEYLKNLELEFNNLEDEEIRSEYLLKILHKLEGSSQYLALSGPIKYIKIIRHSLEHESNHKVIQQIKILFIITHKTIAKLELLYSD